MTAEWLKVKRFIANKAFSNLIERCESKFCNYAFNFKFAIIFFLLVTIKVF